jgi:hypothetical protein
MERSGRPPEEPEVPLADAAIATEIAQAAARGRGADRAPTLEQLLAAFGEPEPTPEARRRVGAALRVAGMGVRPDLLNAEPGQRLLLLPPGAGGSPTRGRAIGGLAALGAVVAAAAIGAMLMGGGNGGGGRRAADDLPAETSTFPITPAGATTTTTTPDTTATTGASPAPAATDTGTTPADTTPAQTGTTPTTPDTTTTPADDQAAAAERRRRRAAQVKHRRAEAQRRAAAARKAVTVRVDASVRPTFLCVDDGHGKTLFSGTLTGKKAFRARRVRLNIGLASTRITVNGNPVRLDGSPAGLDVTRKGGARALPLGNRPCG